MTPLCEVDVSGMAAWVAAIPFLEWPQQKPVDEQLRPAMVTDLSWHGFGEQAWPVVRALGFDERKPRQLMLSVVMPGHSIPPHIDEQGPEWVTRVHVPLLSNDKAEFITGGNSFVMQVGQAYLVDTTAEHAIHNRGETPRIHFMLDIYA